VTVAVLAAATAVADRKLASSAVSASDFSDFTLTRALAVDTVICVTTTATPITTANLIRRSRAVFINLLLSFSKLTRSLASALAAVKGIN
jgi:hypothetical protein